MKFLAFITVSCFTCDNKLYGHLFVYQLVCLFGVSHIYVSKTKKFYSSWEKASSDLHDIARSIIISATAKFPPEKFQSTEEKKPGQPQSSQSQGPKKLPLNSGDQLYSDIRDLNFLAVGPVLSKRAKQISAAFEVITNSILGSIT